MLAIFESILPVFLIILAGNLLRRMQIIDQGGWRGLEQLGYWFLFPALLFVTIANADFSRLQIDLMIVALLGTVLFMCLLTYALWPLLRGLRLVAEGEFSSVYQTAVRWNSFIALAIAQKIFPPEGMAVVALAMVVIIIPINIACVTVLSQFAHRENDWPRLGWNLLTNPMILPCLAAIALRATPFGLYEPLNEALDLAGRAALGIGLIAIGAGLRPADLLRPRVAMAVPLVLKLVFYPLLLIALATTLGVGGNDLAYLTLCAAVPTAMNGYLLARQFDGDAELYATIATVQTAVSFFSIPAMLAFAQFVGG
jgi:malonate transporter